MKNIMMAVGDSFLNAVCDALAIVYVLVTEVLAMLTNTQIAEDSDC